MVDAFLDCERDLAAIAAEFQTASGARGAQEVSDA
jgi:hypothetical protein